MISLNKDLLLEFAARNKVKILLAIIFSILLIIGRSLGWIQKPKGPVKPVEVTVYPEFTPEITAGEPESLEIKEGYVVTLWSMNVAIPEMGYEQAREIVYNKISQLQAKVKNGDITIQEAGNLIKEDKELKQIDKSYKVNAINSFRITSGSDICNGCIRELIPYLWNLSPNEVTEIIEIKRSDRERFFVFGQVIKIIPGKI